jgi:Fe-S-cluster-containing dehydrogenase component/DMSO reductase anchor subunit
MATVPPPDLTTSLDDCDPAASSSCASGLIDAMLVEQGDLTAVERFAQFHAGSTTAPRGKYQAPLLPARGPGAGEQYAFEVDLDRCTGCKACVAACHALNGLDDDESWRDVGLILGGAPNLPVLQHVTSSCHHCIDPACLNVCPTDAYEKDPITGIVKHLDDQCFGCQYCTMACPYDAPKFHKGKGIVRKCDMCADRLKVGEAPACVQGCPTRAIRIRVVDVADVIAVGEANAFLPAAPDADYTLPTTRYTSLRPLQGPVRAADHYLLVPEHAHPPLVIMLVLTQAALGLAVADLAARAWGLSVPWALPLLGFLLLLGGLTASTLHLGRPLYAFRALIGLGHSWLSREVAAFGLFAVAYGALVVAALLQPALATSRLSGLVVASGMAGVICSVMVYHVVRRPLWRASRSGSRFGMTSLVTGLAGSLAVMTSSGASRASVREVCAALAVMMVAKLAFEAAVLFQLRDIRLTSLRRTALLLVGPLRRTSLLRLGLGILGGLVLPLAVAVLGAGRGAALLASLTFGVVLLGEFAERFLFFASVVRPKMPGGMPS